MKTFPTGTDLMSTCQAVYFNLRTGSSVNKIVERMAFACLPVHVGLIPPEETEFVRSFVKGLSALSADPGG